MPTLSRRVSWRNVVAGQRVPLDLTSLGRAWLAAADEETRRPLFERFRAHRRGGWRELSREISAAIDDVRRDGFCWASWQPQVVALATPIVVPDQPVHVLNMSVTADATPEALVERLRDPLLALAQRVRDAIAHL